MKLNFHSFLSILKKSRPFYLLLSSVYHKTPHYKNFLRQQEKMTNRERSIAKKYFNNDLTVRCGPFSGLKYVDTVSSGSYLAKLLGSYEEPIQPWIEQAIKKGYSKIINIGCAEGYYSAGIAKKLPRSTILASDIDAQARKLCRKLAKLNHLNNIRVVGRLSFEKLNKEIENSNTLIICDIEGEEINIFYPLMVPNLRNVDIICEAHDHLIGKRVTDIILERFYKTHEITVTIDYSRSAKKYKILSKIPKEDRAFILKERRSGIARWIKLEKQKSR
jgi:hypothetical protein